MHSDPQAADGRTAEQRWRAAARRTADRVNLGWWLQHFLTPALVWSFLGAALVLYARGRGWPLRPLALAGAAGLLGVMWRALRRHRRQPFTLADALVRLEAQGQLHNRLTAAAAGVAPWPDFDPAVEPGLAWRWRRLLVPPALGLLSLLAAFAVPIRAKALPPSVIQEPASWSQVEQWAETLAETPILQPETLQETQRQLEALRRQPMEEWYGHGSLEAGDHLRDQLQRSISDLGQQLELAAQTLEESLQAAEAAGAGVPLDPQTAGALKQQWQQALQGLRDGSLKLDPALAQKLSQLDPSQLTRQLTPQQLQQLREALKQGCKSCSSCSGGKPGQKPGSCSGTSQMRGDRYVRVPGQGGVNRGRGDAPLTLSDQETQLGSKRTEGVDSADLRNAMLGEVIQVQNTRPDIDPAAYREQAGGAAAAPGGAGEAVWRSDVMPDEQPVLERYFKAP